MEIFFNQSKWNNSSEPPPTTPQPDEDDEPVGKPGESAAQGGQNSRPPQSGPLPQQFRPSQPGVRLVGR